MLAGLILLPLYSGLPRGDQVIDSSFPVKNRETNLESQSSSIQEAYSCLSFLVIFL